MSAPKLNPINQRNGILQIVHDFEFVALNLGTGYTEIRDMNEEENIPYTKDFGFEQTLSNEIENHLHSNGMINNHF